LSVRDTTNFEGRQQSTEDRTFGKLLIDSEEDGTLQAVLVGMLRQGERR
jgi:hypothetical protein